MNKEKNNSPTNKIESLLLSDPFTITGISYYNDRISANDFFKYLYLPLSYKTDYTEDSAEQQTHLLNYEHIVENTSKPLLNIVGDAGTGKTTYLNYLRHTFDSDDLSFYIIDLSSVFLNSVRFFNSTIDIPTDESTDLRFLFMSFVRHISMLLEHEKSNLPTVIKPYRELSEILTFTEVEGFFNLLEMNRDEEAAAFLRDIYVCAERKEDAVSAIMQIATLIMYCLALQGKRQVCAIDNIEYLIRIENGVENNSYIDVLINAISDAVEILEDISRSLKEPLVTYILAARTKTFAFLKVASSNLYNSDSYFLNLNELPSDRLVHIIGKRIYFASKDEQSFATDENIRFIQCVINDNTRSKWSMGAIITKLCNQNYRRIVQLLVHLVDQQRSEDLKLFCDEWARAMETNDTSSKHLVRKNFVNMLVKYCKSIESIDLVINDIVLKELLHMISISNAKPLPTKNITNDASPVPLENFIGREQECQAIQNAIEAKTGIVLITGVAAIGKTEISKKIFATYQQQTNGKIEYLGWINCKGSSLEELLLDNISLELNEYSYIDRFDKIKALINTLADNLLLVFDDLTKISNKDMALLESLRCNIIITSRLAELKNATTIRIGKMPLDDCVRLYKRITEQNHNDEIIAKIAQRAAQIPLVIKLFAETAKRISVTDDEMLDIVIHNQFSMNSRYLDGELNINDHLNYIYQRLGELDIHKGSIINESRIIILGDKGVGKTSLTRRLINPYSTMLTEADSTEAVDVTEWIIPGNQTSDYTSVTAHIWDFAGHVITHMVHRLFMSERCLYILIIDGRNDRNSPEFWLEQIQIYGGNSPVLVLINTSDKNSRFVAEKTLKSEFQSIIGFYWVDIREGGEPLDSFRQIVIEQLRNNPFWNMHEIPASTYKVKEALLTHYRNGNDYISRNEFSQIAISCGITSEKHFDILKDLHCLGICFWDNSSDMQEIDTIILNPHWISYGIFHVINWGHEKNKYVIKISDYRNIFHSSNNMERYPDESAEILFRMMKAYHPVFYKDSSWIFIPILLPLNQPDIDMFKHFPLGTQYLKMECKANRILKQEIITRLIIMHSDELDEELCWRYGAFFRWSNSIALVQENISTNSIELFVVGSEKEEYISRIRETINSILSDYKNTSYKWSSMESFDDLLIPFVQAIHDTDYQKAFELLPKMETTDNIRFEKLIEELSFLFQPGKSLEINKEIWKLPSVEFKAQLWCLLKNENACQESEPSEAEQPISSSQVNESKEETKKEESQSGVESRKKGKKPQEIGSEFEKSVLALLRILFTIDDNEGKNILAILQTLQRRKSGSQGGFDIPFSYKDNHGAKCNCRVECKDTDIDIYQVSGKLVDLKSKIKEGETVHHWILISPNGALADNVKDLLPSWEYTNEWYPIQKVQIWTSEDECENNSVHQLFALVPEIYEKYYPEGKLPQWKQLYPRDPTIWTAEKRSIVAQNWKDKVAPGLPLSFVWREYLRKSYKLLTEREFGDTEKYDDLFKQRADVECFNQYGEFRDISAEQYILKWVYQAEKGSSVMFVLGEFGDGKTFLTYSIIRKLADDFLESPDKGFFPIRFTLKDFGKNKGTRAFLEERFKDIGVNMSEWGEIRKQFGKRILVILDGFDEMSTEMDPETIGANASRLLDCLSWFGGVKLIVTSRTPIFKTIMEQITRQVKECEILHLAPIKREKRIAFLKAFAANDERLHKRLDRLCATHDLVGLASKPLFLEMVKTTLLGDKDIETLNGLTIYESYVEDTLTLKQEQLAFTENSRLTIENVLKTLKQLMEDFALLNLEYSTYSFTSDYFKKYEGEDESLAEKLWIESTSTPKNENDAKTRILNRSLLKAVISRNNEDVNNENKKANDGLSKKEEFEFCHRSMQEYFTAKAICRLICESPQGAERVKQLFLKTSLTFETFEFAGKILKDTKSEEPKNRLLNMIMSTRGNLSDNMDDVARLGAAAVNLYYRAWRDLPGKDWRNLVLDKAYLPGVNFAEKNLSGTSFRRAILDNVNFTGSDLRCCDLTGVSIDETKDTYSIRVIEDVKGKHLCALYSYGKLRRWDIYENKHEELASFDFDATYSIGSSLYYDLILFQKDQILFTSKSDEGVKICGGVRLDVNGDISILDVHGNSVLFANNNKISFYDLDSRSYLINKYPISERSKATIVDDSAILIFGDELGARILLVNGNEIVEKCFDINLERENPKSISSISVMLDHENTGIFWICAGYENGYIVICTFDSLSDKLTVIAPYNCGQYVKNICFLDNSKIAYSGDGVIHILELIEHGECNELIEKEPWKLEIQCSGAQIEGVKKKEQYNKLKEYI